MATKKKTAKPPAKASAPKIGRPKLPEVRLTFAMRLSTEERAGIKAAAAALGIADTAWMRITVRRALGLTGGA